MNINFEPNEVLRKRLSVKKLVCITFLVSFFMLVSCDSKIEKSYDNVISEKEIVQEDINDSVKSKEVDLSRVNKDKMQSSYVTQLEDGYLRVKKSFVLLNDDSNIVFQCDSFVTDMFSVKNEIMDQSDTVFVLKTTLKSDFIFIAKKEWESYAVANIKRYYSVNRDTVKMFFRTNVYLDESGETSWYSSLYLPNKSNNELYFLAHNKEQGDFKTKFDFKKFKTESSQLVIVKDVGEEYFYFDENGERYYPYPGSGAKLSLTNTKETIKVYHWNGQALELLDTKVNEYKTK